MKVQTRRKFFFLNEDSQLVGNIHPSTLIKIKTCRVEWVNPPRSVLLISPTFETLPLNMERTKHKNHGENGVRI